ncbi:hypothetical protein [Streptomyces griseus]|uniref:hypothetical protein n=1 Tax=Streptomyces griseus TaxID=1911 RepID=UPI00131B75EC|nr:hypothetical protein [Streptomyces griseus]
MLADGPALTGFLHHVRPPLAPDGALCCAVVQETALRAHAGRNGVVATDFTEGYGRRQLLFAPLRFDPAGPRALRNRPIDLGTTA